jgi:hypothetical protein
MTTQAMLAAQMTPTQKAVFNSLRSFSVVEKIIGFETGGTLVALTFDGDELYISLDGKCKVNFPGIGPIDVVITE